MSCLVNKFANLGIIASAKDIKKRIRIVVNDLDIARAKRGGPMQCPIACAATRAMNNVTHVFAYASAVTIAMKNPKTGRMSTLRGIPPKNAKDQINGWDAGNYFKPGEYWLEVPTGSQTLEAARERSLNRPGRHHTGKGTITRQPRREGRLQFTISPGRLYG